MITGTFGCYLAQDDADFILPISPTVRFVPWPDYRGHVPGVSRRWRSAMASISPRPLKIT